MTHDENRPSAILDISQTIGTVELDCDGEPRRLIPFADSLELARQLAPRVDLYATYGDRPSEMVDVAVRLIAAAPDLSELFVPGLPPAHPLDAAAPGAPREVFASTSHAHRSTHLESGRRVVPHVSLIEEALDAATFHLAYVRIRVAERRPLVHVLEGLPVVPLFVPCGPSSPLYAITTRRTIPLIEARGCIVERLPEEDPLEQGAPATTSLYVIRDCLDDSPESRKFVDEVRASGFPTWIDPDGLYLALPPTRDISEFHPPRGQHGHTLWMQPDRVGPPSEDCPVLTTSELSDDELGVIRNELTRSSYEDNLWCWTGQAPLPGTVDDRIWSRGGNCPDNPRVAKALCKRLQEILDAGDGRQKSRLLESEPGTKLWNVEGWIDGDSHASPEILVIGAHLDSIDVTSGNKRSPGADDDASGMAAVLSIAAVLNRLVHLSGRPPRRSIRFLLFNLEEVGLVGSNAYRHAVRNEGRVVAMIQMDMIGRPTADPADAYEVRPPGIECFADVLSPCARTRCVELAQLIAGIGTKVQGLLRPEVSAQPKDPMATRSDHASFLRGGMPACLVMENALSAKCTDICTCNDLYHTANDLKVCPEYAATIARVVAAAAWVIAKG
jgi:bacterial leucyl aminopeptidase